MNLSRKKSLVSSDNKKSTQHVAGVQLSDGYTETTHRSFWEVERSDLKEN